MLSRSKALVLLLLIVVLAAALPLVITPDGISADSTGMTNPTTDIPYAGDGFEVSPANAHTDDGAYAENIDGAGQSHIYYNYGFAIPGGATIKGIEVRLDWYLDSDNGTNSVGVELSWNGGSNWTAAQTDSAETTTEHTATLGTLTDNWGRAWNPLELSNGNFRVRVSCNSDDPARDFYLDWVAVNVHYAPVAWLQVTGGGTMTAGGTNPLTVTAMDNEGNVAVNYGGAKILVFSGPAPAPDGQIPTIGGAPVGNNVSANFTGGVATAALVAYRAQTTTVNVTDQTINSTGHGLNLTVNPAAVSRLETTGTAAMTAGDSNQLTITAKDSYGNTDTSYTGAKTLTFSGPGTAPGGQAPTVGGVTVGDNITLTFAAGTSVANLVAYKAEITAVDVTDGGIDSYASPAYHLDLLVNPGTVSHLGLAPDSEAATSGVAFSVTVTAQDLYLNVTPGYTGTVAFSSSDNATGVVLPLPYLFSAADNGIHEYTNGVTLITAGSQTLTISDGSLSDITTWNVVPAADIDHIVISPPSATVIAGDNVTYTVEAFDRYNNSLGDMTSGTRFSIAADAGGTWSGGYGNVYASQYAGIWTVSGEYAGNLGTASLIVDAGPASSIVITPDSPSVAAGGSVTYTAQAFDQYNNSAGDVTSGTTFVIDPLAGGSLVNNVYTSQYAGTWTVTGSYSVMTDDDLLTVTAGPATSVVIAPAEASIAAGSALAYTAQATDQYGNSLGDITIDTDFSIDADAGGLWSANVYTSQNAGTWTVTGNYNSTLGTALLSVGAGEISSYTVTSDNYSLETSIAFTVTVTAYDAYGNVATNDNTTVVTMSSNSSTMIFDGNGDGLFGQPGDNMKTLSAGTFDIQAKDSTAAEGIIITASDGTTTTDSSAYTVENFRCFIATAAYGTPMAGEIQILRDFRDKYLITNPPGRLFVAVYYKLSPPVARFIADHDSLRTGIRMGLTPVLWLASAALKTTLPQKLAILAPVPAVTLIAVLCLRRTRRAGIA